MAKSTYDKTTTAIRFKEGDKVLVKNMTKINKFSPIWEGPYVIKRMLSDVTAEIQIKGKTKKLHTNLLKH